MSTTETPPAPRLLSDIVVRIFKAKDALDSLKIRGAGFYGLNDTEYQFAMTRLEYEVDQFKRVLKNNVNIMRANEQLVEEPAPAAAEEEAAPAARTRKKK